MNGYEKNIISFNRQLGFADLSEKNAGQLKKYPRPDGIVLIGMGGSALPGEVLKNLGSEIFLKMPVLVWKNYGLPKINFKNPFFIFVSFSGNTEETLSGLKKLLAKKNRPAIGAITTGGKLKELAERHNLPLVSFPAGDLTPRASLGYLYHSVIKLLKISFPDIRLVDFPKLIRPESQKKEAKNLAKKLKNKIPLIYTDNENSHLGYIWKINFNETAKQPAFTNVIPELAHNEITAFEDKHFNFFVIFLEDKLADPRIIKKTASVKKLLKSEKIPLESVKLLGKNQEEKTWNAVILSYLTSFYLAKAKRVDPIETNFIDKLKK